MKTILFDLLEAQPTSTSKFHGGGEYIKAVFAKMVEEYAEECRLIVFYDFDKFIDAWLEDILEEKKIKKYNIKKNQDIRTIFEEEKIDVFYSGLPYYYQKKDIPLDVRVKGTVHGLRTVEMPADKYAYLYSGGKSRIKEIVRYVVKDYYRKKKKQEFEKCIELLDDLICVSNHTRFSIMKNYPMLNDREISVFYTPQKKAQFSMAEKSPIENKYILVMGGDRWIKNCYRSILAIEKLFDSGYLKGYKVVVVGNLNPSIKRKISNLSKYIIKDYVETAELETLYKFADFFVYASLNEGFGMPPLEAMKYGITCVVSGVCSLPEVCGAAVYYVNPYDIDEIATRILSAANVKIDPTLVKNQYNVIYQKQYEDLVGVCKFIVGQ